MIEAAFGPADGVLRASGEPLRQACCGGEHIVVVDADGDQTDAFGLLPGQRLAGQQVVLGLGHADQQGPADRRVIPRGDPEFGVPIDDLRGAARHRNVGEQRDNQTRTDGRAPNRRHHRLVEVDQVEHQVAGLAHDAQPALVVADGFGDQVETAAGGKGLAFTADQDHAHGRVAIDHRPDVGKVAVHVRPDRVQPGGVQHQLQHAFVTRLVVDFAAQAGEVVVGNWHWVDVTQVRGGGRGSIEFDEYPSRPSAVAVSGRRHRPQAQPGAGVVHAAGRALVARIPGAARAVQHAGGLFRTGRGL
ncbi:Uncharacterised protein [Mycobacterium tuberculosis]|uniref:Uncharacterized protein n=1 Tax=Mycobacterium tuberculosis TaxID=1773 RepID=A0A655ANB2_MYCTX|nr:Uncharacterised protein [Mycobacterium tuberculosis]